MIQIDLTPIHNLGPGGISNSDLVDGEHIIVRCSKCNKSLCDLWMTQPNLDVYTKLTATCDYCGDKSYEKSVKGKFHLGITEDSAISDAKYEFIDGPAESSGIYQKVKLITKRLK
jgi:hypothetical protein